MEDDDYLANAQRKQDASSDGRAMLPWGTLTVTSEQERAIRKLAGYSNFKSTLQNADGSFIFAPQDDGTFATGRFGIDAFGRFVAI